MPGSSCCCVPWSYTPPGADSPARTQRAAIAFEECNPLGTGNELVFEAAFPTAHSLAHLRVADRLTAIVARLASGWAGSPLAGRESHPLDEKPNFMKSFAFLSFPSDQPCLVALLFLTLSAACEADSRSNPHRVYV